MGEGILRDGRKNVGWGQSFEMFLLRTGNGVVECVRYLERDSIRNVKGGESHDTGTVSAARCANQMRRVFPPSL